jgi:hypothetical protein
MEEMRVHSTTQSAGNHSPNHIYYRDWETEKVSARIRTESRANAADLPLMPS